MDFAAATGYNATQAPPHLEHQETTVMAISPRKLAAARQVQDHDRDRPVGNFDG